MAVGAWLTARIREQNVKEQTILPSAIAHAPEAVGPLWPPAIDRLARWMLDRQWLVLACLYLLGLAPRLWDSGRRSFLYDEPASVGIAALPFDQFRVAQWVEANMSMYRLALFVWLRLVGVGAEEGTIRLLSAMLGAAAVPLTYLLGRRLHSHTAGLIAAGLLVVHSYHASLSQEARAYAAFSSLTVLSYLMLDHALVGGRRRDWVLHGLVTSLAFYSHFFTAFTILAQGLFVLSRRSRAALLGLLWSGAIMALILAQLVPFFLQLPNASRLGHLDGPDFGYVLSTLDRLGGANLAMLAAYVILAALGIGLGGAAARSSGYGSWLLLTWLLGPLGLALGIFLVRPIFKDRYFLAILPALPLLAGVGLARLPRATGPAVFGAAAGLSLWVLLGHMPDRGDQRWREAVSHAMGIAQPGDGWIFASKLGQNAFEYYAGWHWNRNPAAPLCRRARAARLA
jgi:mannosyltransferase